MPGRVPNYPILLQLYERLTSVRRSMDTCGTTVAALPDLHPEIGYGRSVIQ